MPTTGTFIVHASPAPPRGPPPPYSPPRAPPPLYPLACDTFSPSKVDGGPEWHGGSSPEYHAGFALLEHARIVTTYSTGAEQYAFVLDQDDPLDTRLPNAPSRSHSIGLVIVRLKVANRA